MIHPKFITLLVNLSAKELTSLRKHVLSKTSKDADIFRLYTYLHLRNLKLGSFTDIQALQEAVFPKSTIKTVANYLSTLYQWAEEWMQMRQLEEEKYTADLLTLKWLNKRGLYNLANQTAKNLEKEIEDDLPCDIEKSFANARMLHVQYMSNNPISFEGGVLMLQDLVDSFCEYTKASMLMYAIEMENYGAIKHHDYSKTIRELSISVQSLPDTKLTEIIGSAYAMFTKKDIEALLTLKDNLMSGQLKQESEVHRLLAFYMQKMIASSSTSFSNLDFHQKLKLSAEIFEYNLKSGAIFSQGKLTIISFINTLMNVSPLYSFEDTDQFIETWFPRIYTKNPDATKALCKALNSFYHHRFDDVLQLTWRSDFELFNQKNIAQCLHTLAAFINRKKNMELYQISLHNSKGFLKRNRKKMSPGLFLGYANLYDFLEKINAGQYVDLQSIGRIQFSLFCNYVLENKK